MTRRHLTKRLSAEELSLGEVWEWYDFQSELISEEKVRTLAALLAAVPLNKRYFGKTRDDLVEFFDGQVRELNNVTMLNLLSATEAALRVDYIIRVINGKKDEVSKAFAALYREQKQNVAPEEQILDVWNRDSAPETKLKNGEFNGALKLRHWLAHGRYWKPRLGRLYDPKNIFWICNALLKAIIPRE